MLRKAQEVTKLHVPIVKLPLDSNHSIGTNAPYCSVGEFPLEATQTALCNWQYQSKCIGDRTQNRKLNATDWSKGVPPQLLTADKKGERTTARSVLPLFLKSQFPHL